MRYNVQIIVGGLLIFVLWGARGIEGQASEKETPTVVRSEVGLDQMVIAPEDSRQEVGAKLAAVSAEERPVVLLNESLRNALEENQRLMENQQKLEGELKVLRGEKEIKANRIETLTRQRDDLRKKLDEVDVYKKQFDAQLQQLEESMAAREKEFQQKWQALEAASIKKEMLGEYLPWVENLITERAGHETSSGGPAVKDMREENFRLKVESAKLIDDLKTQAQEALQHVQENIRQASAKIGKLEEENARLKVDSAKMHYNLANVFFEKRQYAQAALEYKKVLEFMPADADTHYNLAFVSGKYLSDLEAALNHYEEYLRLKPEAQDASWVKSQIVEIKTHLDARTQAPLETELQKLEKSQIK